MKKFKVIILGRLRKFGAKGAFIKPGTKKGDSYCARSAGIKKCKNPPCANDLSRAAWGCVGKKSYKSRVRFPKKTVRL